MIAFPSRFSNYVTLFLPQKSVYAVENRQYSFWLLTSVLGGTDVKVYSFKFSNAFP